MATQWNWGKSIVVMIVAFILIWVGLVIFAFNQKVDLVTPNYYEQELKYQQEIDKQKNTNMLAGKLTITQESDGLVLQFPVKETGPALDGTVSMYRPSDSQHDKTFPVKIDTTGVMHVPYKGLRPGFYKVKVQWFSPTQKYFNEESIRIQ